MRKILLSGLLLASGFATMLATPVQVRMNDISKTMSLVGDDGSPVNVGEPQNMVYSFDVAPGKYVLTGIEKDKFVNGTIELNVEDRTDVQVFNIYTVQLYVTNADFSYGSDYTIDVTVTSNDGNRQVVTIGECHDAVNPRSSVLVFNGNTVVADYIPSEARKAEGYGAATVSATITNNSPLSTTLKKVNAFVVTLPADAGVEVGTKRSHYTEFSVVDPVSTEVEGDKKKITFHLTSNKKYNVRTWRKDGLTYAYYFGMRDGVTNIEFTEQTYKEYDPKQVNHDPTSNQGYETGDIFVNINERNHLVMNVGDTFDAHAMRTWELTDTQIDNYFFEPDFHYTVIGLDGKPSTGVIEVSTDDTTSPWRTIKAVGNGTAIVLVTYDAIKVSRPDASAVWMGGEYWGAIWPENTAAYVVTVGEESPSIIPNMIVNEKYNAPADGQALKKLAGINVDAEHDVFYYLDTEEGYNFTFTPEGVSSVTIAYPVIGKNAATYNGFGSQGVTANTDGSYTLLLKHGRNIVKLTDAAGKSVYQVINAKPCHYEITNESRKGSDEFYHGDKVKIQYSGLFHPANKLAGIYNMSAYVTYNGVPNGTSLILGSGQYTFGSASSAQAVEFEIPEDFSDQEYVMTEGVIQVVGYGDPIGNHRNTDRNTGRFPNFNAVAHKTYFGAIPEVRIPISIANQFKVKVDCNVENAEIEIKKEGKVIEPNADGTFTCGPDTYSILVRADGYRVYTDEFTLTNDMKQDVTITVQLESCPEAWDGKSKTKPALIDGVYQIGTGAELAWFSAEMANNTDIDAILTADIELNLWNWSPISKYKGHFNGNGHCINNLYVENGSAYSGLFSYVEGTAEKPARIEGVTVTGKVTSKMGAAGIAANTKYTEIDRCVNLAYIEGTNGFMLSGGITAASTSSTVITNCVNGGEIVSTKKGAGISAQPGTATCTIKNCLNYGKYPSTSLNSNPCAGAVSKSDLLVNLFALETEKFSDGSFAKDGSEFVSAERMASGEIAWRLGEAFGQSLGEDAHPVLNGASVYKVTYTLINNTEVNTLSNTDTQTVLYTNGILPNELDGQEVHWFADADLTIPVTSVEADTNLYAKIGIMTGIGNINVDENADIRWFNIQGVEVAAPDAGTHGIFIRVVNGNSEKVVL